MDTMLDIWHELGEQVRRFVGSRVRDPATADDLAQDVMLKVQANLGTFPPEEKLPAWVLAVARNAVIDYYRARAVRDHDNLADADMVAAAGEDERQETLRDLAPCLMRMVERLPEPYRAAMKLADFDGQSQQEVADRAGISLSGAKSRIQRARQMLREMVEDCCRIERDRRGNAFDFETTERSGWYCGTKANAEPNCGS